jgi:hypothetical protein
MDIAGEQRLRRCGGASEQRGLFKTGQPRPLAGFYWPNHAL